MEKGTIDIFKNGATWLRADFHLHTKAGGINSPTR